MKLSLHTRKLFQFYSDGPSHFTISALIALIQQTGVHAISIPMHSKLLEHEPFLQFIRSGIGITCIIECPQNDQLLSAAIKLKPNMIILGDEESETSFTINPFRNDIPVDLIKESILNLEAHNISAGIFMEPDMKLIRSIKNLDLDWLVLSTVPLFESTDSNDVIMNLENLSNCVVAGKKLGMGISLSGDFPLDRLDLVQEITHIDEIIVHEPFWSCTPLYGAIKTTELLMSHLKTKGN